VRCGNIKQRADLTGIQVFDLAKPEDQSLPGWKTLQAALNCRSRQRRIEQAVKVGGGTEPATTRIKARGHQIQPRVIVQFDFLAAACVTIFMYLVAQNPPQPGAQPGTTGKVIEGLQERQEDVVYKVLRVLGRDAHTDRHPVEIASMIPDNRGKSLGVALTQITQQRAGALVAGT